MHLNYDKSIPANAEPLVLRSAAQERVEIHLRQDADGVVTLLAFAGRGDKPERSVPQGPYERVEQAIAAKRAIAAELLRHGYSLATDVHPLWNLDAQRTINKIRSRKLASKASYAFDPKDVFLDW